MPVSHSGLLLSRAVARQTVRFLDDGRFAHEFAVRPVSSLR